MERQQRTERILRRVRNRRRRVNAEAGGAVLLSLLAFAGILDNIPVLPILAVPAVALSIIAVKDSGII